jgi:predicted small secreted protein
MKKMILSIFVLCFILSACNDDIPTASGKATDTPGGGHDSHPTPGGGSQTTPPQLPPPIPAERGICNSHGQCASEETIENIRTIAQAELTKFKNKPASSEENQFRKSFALSQAYKYLTGFDVTDEDSKFLGDLYRAVYQGEGQ